MHIIDTHCHIGLHKYEPVETLLYHMQRAGVAQAVFIQYMGNTDNAYLAETIAAYPGQFAAAMLAPADDDGSAIRGWAEQDIGGIRLAANFRGTGSDPLAHWRTADELGLVVSAPSSPASLASAEFAEVLRLFPNLPIVIEHLGGARPGMTTEEFQPVLALAAHENLTIKLPGFGEFCHLPHPFRDVPVFADGVLEAFGPRRMMWGSDWPPVSSREGYDSSLSFPLDYFADLSEDERAWIFGKTARSVWKLPGA
ncbi:MAG: amidohydrolase family protein [Caldilineaceae bacterium]